VIVVVTPDGSAFITTSDTLPVKFVRLTVALDAPLLPPGIVSCVGLRPSIT
jgi:hypothetical protein